MQIVSFNNEWAHLETEIAEREFTSVANMLMIVKKFYRG